MNPPHEINVTSETRTLMIEKNMNRNYLFEYSVNIN